MKIVFIRNGLTSGGLGIMSAVQANYFYNKGFDVTVIVDQAYTPNLLNSANAKMYDKGIKIIPALTSVNNQQCQGVERKNKSKEWFKGKITEYYDQYGVLVKKSYNDIKKQRVKIVIPVLEEYISTLKEGDMITTLEASFLWYIGNLNVPKGVSKIAQIHNQHFFRSPWIDNISKYDALVCMTEKTKFFYEKLYGKKENIVIIPNPLRVTIPNKNMPHSERKFKIVTVGRIVDGKQPYDTIKAFQKINKMFPNSFLEFYGTGTMVKELKEYTKTLSISDKIYFRGYESDLSKVFSDASLMLFPSKRESFGLVILEAFAYGVPIVAYSTKFGVDDLIDNNKNGYILKQNDINNLAEKAIYLLKNPLIRDSFGNNGHNKVYDFMYDKVMLQWFNLVKGLSPLEISEKQLKLKLLKRVNLPNSMYNYIVSANYSLNDLDSIIELSLTAKAKIINGKAYIYSKKLIEEYSIPLISCDV